MTTPAPRSVRRGSGRVARAVFALYVTAALSPVVVLVVVLVLGHATPVQWAANLFAVTSLVAGANAWVLARNVFNPGDLHGLYAASAALFALVAVTGLVLGGTSGIVLAPRLLWFVVLVGGVAPNAMAHARTVTVHRIPVTDPVPALARPVPELTAGEVTR
ncbi:MAG: hypothetical protein AAF467_27335 [Actinomycetota bacterium]